jgi:hypothetical protein
MFLLDEVEHPPPTRMVLVAEQRKAWPRLRRREDRSAGEMDAATRSG